MDLDRVDVDSLIALVDNGLAAVDRLLILPTGRPPNGAPRRQITMIARQMTLTREMVTRASCMGKGWHLRGIGGGRERRKAKMGGNCEMTVEMS